MNWNASPAAPEVTEPGTIALIALGLLAIAVRRWKENHKR
ncbi:PEP-CTERM sorting domain-containing protein [Marinobacter sp.]